MKNIFAAFLVSLLAVGCAAQYDVTFDNPAPYNIATPRQDAGVTAVIDQETLARRVPVKSFMAGAANNWEVRPGDMLRQVADIELPQMFSGYAFSSAAPAKGADGMVLELAIPYYEFAEFRAKVMVTAVAYAAGRREIMRKSYTATGESQGAKMFWGGAFGMKSAIRQSSLDAYKKIFGELRTDLQQAAQQR